MGEVRVEVLNLVELGREDDVYNFLTLLLFQNLLSAQLWNLLLTRCCPIKGGGAKNVFRSNRRSLLLAKSYL